MYLRGKSIGLELFSQESPSNAVTAILLPLKVLMVKKYTKPSKISME
jgi:hypothetical protein